MYVPAIFIQLLLSQKETFFNTRIIIIIGREKSLISIENVKLEEKRVEANQIKNEKNNPKFLTG